MTRPPLLRNGYGQSLDRSGNRTRVGGVEIIRKTRTILGQLFAQVAQLVRALV